MYDVRNWEEYTYYLLIYLKDNQPGKFREDFLQLHRNDQLRFFYILESGQRRSFYDVVKPKEFAPVFAKLTLLKKREVLTEVDRLYEITVIQSLPSDEVGRFFREIEKSERDDYLLRLPEQKANQIQMLLSFKEGTAGSLMMTEFVTARKNESVEVVLKRLFKQGKFTETIYYIYIVTRTNRLIGVVALHDLMGASSNHSMSFIMKRQVVSVRPTAGEVEVVSIMMDYDLLLVPVINKSQQLIGIITVDDVMDINDIERGGKRKLTYNPVSQWGHFLLIGILLFSSLLIGTIFGHSGYKISLPIFMVFLIISIIGGIGSTFISEAILNRFIHK